MLLHLVFILSSANDVSETQTGTSTTAETGQPMTNTTNLTVSVSGNGTISTKKTDCASHNQTTELLDILLNSVKDPPVLVSFGIGVFVTAIICCLVHKCCRCICCRSKQKSSGNLTESLEMVSTQSVRPIESGQQHKTEAKGLGGETSGQTEPHCNAEDHQVEYSDIDFSALRKQRAAKETQETTESDYAEIKRETTEEIEQNTEELKEDEVLGDGLENEHCEQTEEWVEEEPLCQVPGHNDA